MLKLAIFVLKSLASCSKPILRYAMRVERYEIEIAIAGPYNKTHCPHIRN